jgi:hypothetical protein
MTWTTVGVVISLRLLRIVAAAQALVGTSFLGLLIRLLTSLLQRADYLEATITMNSSGAIDAAIAKIRTAILAG